METKTCRICQKELPINDFQVRGSKRRNECKKCLNAYHRERYALIHGKRLEKRRKSREADPKRCIKCGEEKPLAEFGFHNRKKGQHRNMCKTCQSEWAKKYNKSSRGKENRENWKNKNAEKIKAYYELYRNDPAKQKASKKYHRNYWLRTKFGITAKDYGDMLAKQDGKCAICGATESHSKGNRLCIDHDHKTGKVRGLLCHNCNVGIGNFKDSLLLFREAINYLELDR